MNKITVKTNESGSATTVIDLDWLLADQIGGYTKEAQALIMGQVLAYRAKAAATEKKADLERLVMDFQATSPDNKLTLIYKAILALGD